VTVEARPYPEAESVRAGGETVGAPEDAEDVTVAGDALLVAAGRRPNTDALNLDATGVETDADGFVETDEYLQNGRRGRVGARRRGWRVPAETQREPRGESRDPEPARR